MRKVHLKLNEASTREKGSSLRRSRGMSEGLGKKTSSRKEGLHLPGGNVPYGQKGTIKTEVGKRDLSRGPSERGWPIGEKIFLMEGGTYRQSTVLRKTYQERHFERKEIDPFGGLRMAKKNEG